jgi:hypothetical protein
MADMSAAGNPAVATARYGGLFSTSGPFFQAPATSVRRVDLGFGPPPRRRSLNLAEPFFASSLT